MRVRGPFDPDAAHTHTMPCLAVRRQRSALRLLPEWSVPWKRSRLATKATVSASLFELAEKRRLLSSKTTTMTD